MHPDSFFRTPSKALFRVRTVRQSQLRHTQSVQRTKASLEVRQSFRTKKRLDCSSAKLQNIVPEGLFDLVGNVKTQSANGPNTYLGRDNLPR